MASSPPDPAHPPDDEGAPGVQLVFALWHGMRAKGVRLTPDQLTAGLSLAKFAGPDQQRLTGMLIGVFAKDAAEFALFHQLLQTEGSAQNTTSDARVSPVPTATKRVSPGLSSWITGAQVAAASLGAGAVHLLPRVRESSQPRPPPPRPPSEAASPQSLNLHLSEETLVVHIPAPPPWWQAAEYAVVALPLFLVLAFALWRRTRAPTWMRLSVDRQEQLLENDLREPPSDNLFTGPAIRRLARGLRRARPSQSGEIDIPRTVAATVAAAGRLMLIQASPTRARALHLAIERDSREDHLAQLFTRAGQRLMDLGATVRIFHFRRDIQILFDEDGKRLSAAAAAAMDDDPLLALVGEGEGLEGTASPLEMARSAALQAWPTRHLLSTRRASAWDLRESRIVGRGISVSPANEVGLIELSAQLDRDKPALWRPSLRDPPRIKPRPSDS